MAWMEEAATICALRFCRAAVDLVSVDSVIFRKPSRVGQSPGVGEGGRACCTHDFASVNGALKTGEDAAPRIRDVSYHTLRCLLAQATVFAFWRP